MMMDLLRALTATTAGPVVDGATAVSTSGGDDASADHGAFMATLVALLHGEVEQHQSPDAALHGGDDTSEDAQPDGSEPTAHWPLALLAGLEPIVDGERTWIASPDEAGPDATTTDALVAADATMGDGQPPQEAARPAAALPLGDTPPIDEAGTDVRVPGVVTLDEAEPTSSPRTPTSARVGDLPLVVSDTSATAHGGGDQPRGVEEPVARTTELDGSTRPVPQPAPGRDAADDAGVPVPTPSDPAPAAAGRSPGRTAHLADGVRRVLDAIELLESAPPPRQLTIEVGEGRLRVALEDGQVRLTALDASADADELLQAAEDALTEHGFDLDREGRGDRRSHDEPPSSPDRRPRPAARPTGRGLWL